MFYEKSRPIHLKQLKKLQSWNGNEESKTVNDFKQNFVQFLLDFGRQSSIHGINNLSNPKKHFIERIAWLLLLLTVSYCTVDVCLNFSASYYNRNLETIIEHTEYEVFRIDFPSITICNRNRLNWQRFEEAKKLFLPHENDAEILDLFELIISLHDDIKFPNFEKFNKLKHKPLHLLNHVNFSLVYDFMTWQCDEFLIDCKWHNHDKNCCEIFAKRKTKMGLCWSFNSKITNRAKEMLLKDSKWPWRTGTSGAHSALQVMVLIQPESHYPGSQQRRGIEVMITEVNSWHAPPIFISRNTQTSIIVQPVLYQVDNNTRSLSVKERNCAFEDETKTKHFKTLHGFTHTMENCIAECHQEYLMKYCNCTMNLLFPEGLYPYCTTEQLSCLGQSYDYLQYTYESDKLAFVLEDSYAGKAMACDCFRNCHSFKYITEARSTYISTERRQNKSYIDLEVHYGDDTFMVYRTRLAFSWLSLLVSFGSIIGLFMGCSVLSIMELLYFLCVDLPIFLGEQLKMKLKKRKVPTNHSRIFHYPIYQNKAWPKKEILSNPQEFLYSYRP